MSAFKRICHLIEVQRSIFFIALKISNFVPERRHLREVLLHYFFLKKSAAESHRLLVEAYKEHAPSISMCEKWFKRFRNNDFDLDDKKHGKLSKKFENT